MEISQKLFAVILLWSCAVGAFIGVIWDVFRIIRVATTPSDENNCNGFYGKILIAAAAVEDIVFSIIAALIVTVFIYHTNNGQPRWFALFGCGLGFYVYYNTIGRLVISIAKPLTVLTRKIIAFIFRIIAFPFILLFKASYKLFSAIYLYLKRLFLHICTTFYRKGCIRRIKREAVLQRKRREKIRKFREKNNCAVEN